MRGTFPHFSHHGPSPMGKASCIHRTGSSGSFPSPASQTLHNPRVLDPVGVECSIPTYFTASEPERGDTACWPVVGISALDRSSIEARVEQCVGRKGHKISCTHIALPSSCARKAEYVAKGNCCQNIDIMVVSLQTQTQS